MTFNTSTRHQARCIPGRLLGALTVCVGLVCGAGAAWAQEEREIPEPVSRILETKDGVQLQTAWFPPINEKEAIPVILIHDWNGQGADLGPLASFLHQQGHAVIVPDLRGHGGSTRLRGVEAPIDRERFTKVEIAGMSEDIETCKRFLMEQNNEGQLNIELLTVVAVGDMSLVATDWALRDWSWPAIAGRKQGQDVKALVLLSPTRTFKGLSIAPALRNPLLSGRGAQPLSMLIAVGGRAGGPLRDARNIYETLERSRPDLDLSGSEEDQMRERLEKQDLFLQEYDVDFQGAALVDPRARLNLHETILGFLNARLINKLDTYRWTDRSARD
ncbi:MAG: hypothetical protein R3B96_20295 [Pirellulaceae bacterium]